MGFTVRTHFGDVSRISVWIRLIAAKKCRILVRVDGIGQCRLPLARVRFVYDEFAHRVTGEDVFQDVERESKYFRS